MADAGERAGDRRPVLSGASAADQAAEEDAARSRGRQSRLVHEVAAPRMRPRAHLRLRSESQTQLAARVRASVRAIRGNLSLPPIQQELRAAFGLLLRAIPPGRGFRRDVRRVADAGSGLAQQVQGLEGARQTLVRRQADGRHRRQAAAARDGPPVVEGRDDPQHAQALLSKASRRGSRGFSGIPRRQSAAHVRCSEAGGRDTAAGRQAIASAPQGAVDHGGELDRRAPLHGQRGLQRRARAQPRVAFGRRRVGSAGDVEARHVSDHVDDELPLHDTIAWRTLAMSTRVLMVFDLPYAVKPDYDFAKEFADPDGSYTENDVWKALLECGYEVHRLSLFDDVRPLLDAVRDIKPDVIFNLCETFRNAPHWDKNIVATMELLGVPCTGASSHALFLCNDKSLCKKILRFHRVRTPRFHTYYRGHKVWLPKTLKLASIVDDEAAFLARIAMIHERMNLDAIAEEYIDGREMYVSIIGDRAMRVLPAREMTFGQMDEDEPRIATYKAKWDDAYRKRWGIKNHFAKALEPELQQHIDDVCKRAYRALNIRSYARFDLRVTSAGNV